MILLDMYMTNEMLLLDVESEEFELVHWADAITHPREWTYYGESDVYP